MRLIRRPVGVPELRVGDRVRLNSGGPDMIVFEIDYWGAVSCNWLVGLHLRAAAFPPVCLTQLDARQ